MKSNATLRVMKSCFFFAAFALISAASFSQAPMFKFQGASLTSGTALTKGAVYRFPSVVPNVDALVTIKDIVGGIALTNIDRTADGYSEAFQPEYKLSSLSNGYIDFEIEFVKPGTNSSLKQPLIDATGLDIDGSTSGLLSLKEFNLIDMGGGICTFNTMSSHLSIQKVGTGFSGNNITGVLYGALVDTAAYQVMFTVSNANVDKFNYRVGASTLISSSSTRYASLYFKKFNYPTESILPVSNLQNFNGSSKGDKTSLQWLLTAGNNVASVVLEKALTANAFEPVASFSPNADGQMQREFNYVDNGSKGGVQASAYYRLKIIGADGRVQYSNVLYFKGQKSDALSFAVYPSTVNSAVTAQVYSTQQESASFEVYDYSGRVVYRQALQLQEGQNNVRINNLDGLPAGNYISTLKTSVKMYSCKINKL